MAKSEDIRNTALRNEFVQRLESELETNLGNEQFGVDSLAHALGISRSSLHRKLQKHLGISTSRFMREYRLRKALEILRQEDVTASETAFRVGFSSPTYFTTCFNKFYGFTPGEVKSQNIEDIDKLIEHERTIKEKHGKTRTTFWVVLTIVSAALLVAYYHGINLREEKPWQAPSITVNEKSIAVLPLKNWTGDPNLEYVSDGMTDAIISGLSKIKSIDKVTPYSFILKYKNTDETPTEIAMELGVAKLVQGNLQIAGNQIKVNLHLIDAISNEQIWSQEYINQWQSDEIFKLQKEVVQGIAKVMEAGIEEKEMKQLQKVPTRNKKAYSYYLQAQFQLNKTNASAYSNAIPLYEKAIALDSTFVDAYRGLANVFSIGGLLWGNINEQVAWKNAKNVLESALKIDPDNIEILEHLHYGYFYYDWDFKKVEDFFQKGLKDSLRDEFPPINADYAIKTGRYQDAVNAMEERILMDPSVGVIFCFKARALLSLHKNKEAKAILDSTNGLYNDNFGYLGEAAKQYFYLGEYEKSKFQLNKILAKFPDYPPILMWLSAVHAQREDDSEAMEKYLAELDKQYNEGASGSPAWFIALYYCNVKNYDQTFKWLKRSFERHEVEMTWLREEPLLSPIRNDPRYETLYGKVGFSEIGLPIKQVSEKDRFQEAALR